MKWLNQIPILRLVLPYSLGIITSFYWPHRLTYNQLILTTIFFIFLIGIISLNRKTPRRFYVFLIGITTTCIFFCLGYLISNSKIELFQSNHFSKNTPEQTETIIYKGIVASEPEEKKKSWKTIIEIQAINQSKNWTNSHGKVLTYIKKDSSTCPKYGEVFLFSIKPQIIQGPSNFDEFDYKRYLSHHYVYHQVYLPSNKIQFIGNIPNSILKQKAIECRNFLLKNYKNARIKEDELAILSALTLGKKESLTSELKSAYASAGAMHVLAVSGLHVGIVFLIVRSLLGWMAKIRYGSVLKAIILIIAIWTYAFITGLSPSVMRASTMFSFMIIAQSLKLNSNIYNTLGLSALLILIIEPYMLLEVGFQLSYLAVIGIIFLQPYLYNLLYFKPWILNKAWEITCVSISAQIVTAPLGILYFHQFPTYFLFSNIIVIPSAFAILVTAIMYQMVSTVPILGFEVGEILHGMVFVLNNSVKWIESLPASLIGGLDITILETWILYITILSISIWLIYKRPQLIKVSLFGILAFTISQTLEKWYQIHQSEIVVYDTGRSNVIETCSGNSATYYGDSATLQNKELMLFSVYHHDWKRGLNTLKSNTSSKNQGLIQFGKLSLLVLSKNQPIHSNSIQKLNPDIILIDDMKQFDFNKSVPILKKRIVIIGKRCPPWVRSQITHLKDSLDINLIDTKRSGAIKLSLNQNLSEIQNVTTQKPH